MTEPRAPYLVNTLTPAELRLARHRIAGALLDAQRAINRARKECADAGIVIDLPAGSVIVTAIEQLADVPLRKASPCPSEEK